MGLSRETQSTHKAVANGMRGYKLPMIGGKLTLHTWILLVCSDYEIGRI
jgi:hypothetical protein